MPIITLRYQALCRECGARLKPGARVRYYGSGARGGIYGLDCHGKTARGETPIDKRAIKPGK